MCGTKARAHRAVRGAAVFFLLSVGIVPLEAAETDYKCIATDTTYGDCFNRLWNTVQPPKTKESRQRLTAQQISDLVAPDISSEAAGALTDFIPRLLTSLGIDGLNGEGFELGFDKPFLRGQDGPLSYSLGAQMSEPKLFESLVNALPEGGRADQKSVLEDQLGDFDSVEIRLRLAWEKGERIGRNPRSYVTYFNKAFDAVTGSSSAQKDLVKLLTALGKDMDDASTLINGPRDALNPAQRTAIEAAIGLAIAEEAKRLRTIDSELAKVAALISNQPQLLVDFTRKERDELTGVSQWLYELRYEQGFGNLNGFKKWRTGTADPCAGLGELACIDKFRKDKSASTAGHRVALSASYVQDDEYSFAQEGAASPLLELAASEKWVASLTYGRQFVGGRFFGTTTAENLRFDLEAKYEDPSEEDEMRRSRFVATGTLTQKLTDGTSLAFSAVYANRPEFLGEVDEELSARFGLRWKLKEKED